MTSDVPNEWSEEDGALELGFDVEEIMMLVDTDDGVDYFTNDEIGRIMELLDEDGETDATITELHDFLNRCMRWEKYFNEVDIDALRRETKLAVVQSFFQMRGLLSNLDIENPFLE